MFIYVSLEGKRLGDTLVILLLSNECNHFTLLVLKKEGCKRFMSSLVCRTFNGTTKNLFRFWEDKKNQLMNTVLWRSERTICVPTSNSKNIFFWCWVSYTRDSLEPLSNFCQESKFSDFWSGIVSENWSYIPDIPANHALYAF